MEAAATLQGATGVRPIAPSGTRFSTAFVPKQCVIVIFKVPPDDDVEALSVEEICLALPRHVTDAHSAY